MPFRDAGFLDPRELHLAESIQAPAWESLAHDGAIADMSEETAKARLAAIVRHLMNNRDQCIGNLSAAAVEAVKNG